MADDSCLFACQAVQAVQKRKRQIHDLIDDDNAHESKRRSLTFLPIRSSPSTPLSFGSTPSFPPFSTPIGTLTPDHTSEDESYPQQKLDDPWTRDRHTWSKPPKFNRSSTWSLQVHTDDPPEDPDMIMTPSRPRIGRARSNDLISPRHRLSQLSPPTTMTRDRVPTPINSHFDTRLLDSPNVPRNGLPPLRTSLSPMMEQETWASSQGMISPAEEKGIDDMIMVDQTNEGMNGLRVNDDDDVMDAETHDAGRSGRCRHGEHESPRTARLHMGFLGGCEKCNQKVPGHYSHILWS